VSHKSNNWFAGRTIAIGTLHNKQQVIAPLLAAHLQVACTTVPIDTDALGTFSGEVNREYDVPTTLRKKCELTLAASNASIAVASEGSFGPHPHMYWLYCNQEAVMLYDSTNNITVIGSAMSTITNFAGKHINNIDELIAFASDALMPTHALILKPSEHNNSHIIKGITQVHELIAHFEALQAQYGSAYLLTDMRAMHNPARMQVIGDATLNLIQKLQSACPQCNMPGFAVVAAEAGLPCSLCGMATNSTLYYQYTCAYCKHSQQQLYPHGKRVEDPQYCNYCNP
jgi:hypothetical protein